MNDHGIAVQVEKGATLQGKQRYNVTEDGAYLLMTKHTIIIFLVPSIRSNPHGAEAMCHVANLSQDSWANS